MKIKNPVSWNISEDQSKMDFRAPLAQITASVLHGIEAIRPNSVALTLDLIKPTPANYMAPQNITDCRNITLDLDSMPLHSSSRLWDLDFQMKCKIYFHLKAGLCTTEQQSSLFSS